MPAPLGFDYANRADGTVLITHRGTMATTLRGRRAAEFLAEVEAGDPQQVMARWTGTIAAEMNEPQTAIPETCVDSPSETTPAHDLTRAALLRTTRARCAGRSG